MQFTYDDIYGIDLNEYCLRHQTTKEELITKIQIDIDILKDNLAIKLNEGLPYPDSYIETVIWGLINKKQKHINRIQTWE